MTSRLISQNVGAPEGPVCLNDGTMYVTEMSGATLCISRIDANGQKQLVKKQMAGPMA